MHISLLDPKRRDRDKAAGEHIFSASQIKLWRTCKLCWACKYIAKVDRADSFAAIKGKAIHSILEAYLKEGKPIDPNDKYGKFALPGIQYLPLPGIAKVEQQFYMSIDGILLNGYIDFIYEKEKHIVVGDHKTTKNFKYGLTEEKLATDIQSNIYALFATLWKPITHVELNWVYYKSEGKPESKLIKCDLDLQTVSDSAKLIIEDCEEMLDALRTGKTPHDFSPPESGCNGYGGCLGKDFALIVEGKDMSRSLLDDLKKNQIQKAQAIPQTVIQEAVETKTEEDEVFDNIPLELEEEISDEFAPFVPMKEENLNNYTLLIDCHPIKAEGNVYTVPQVTKLSKSIINRRYDTTHYRFIDFGKGPAALALELDNRMAKGYLINGEIIVADSGSQETKDVLHILEKYAKTIIGGIK